MSFREVSAWVMALVMAVTGALYLKTYLATSAAQGGGVPDIDISIRYTVAVVTLSIIAQIVLAAVAPKSANRPPDEREQPQLWRAGHWAGLLQGGLSVGALGYVIHHHDTAILFHLIVGGLILSQIAEYAFQIALLRRSA